MIKNIIIFTLMLSECLLLQGQAENARQVIPPSPNAASLGIYGDIPVGYYTGVPNISIPLYNIVSGNIEVPITLSYHASGIKVAQEASWVGLGWALNAGGCITRTVKGWDDFGSGSDEFHPRGYSRGLDLPEDSAYTMPLKELTYGIGYYSLYALNEEDSEPDIFYYNFGKYSGKIMISKDEGPMVMNQDPLKIEGFGNTMTIITPEGNSYYFGTIEETDKYNYILASGYRKETIDPNVINTWYLDSIVSPQNDKVIFKYKKSLDCIRNQLSATNNVLLDAGDDTPLIPWLIGGAYSIPHNGWSYETFPGLSFMLTVTDEVLLDSVIFKGGHIKFVTQNRTDLIAEDPSNAVPKGIDSLIIYNNQNSVVNSYSFGTSYFSSTAGTNNQERLKLDSVTDLSGKKYSFSYNEQITLPKKTSSSMDHWGYYNGANNEEFDDYAAIPIIMYESGIDTIIYAGANREASEEMAKAAILNRVGYPTGGYTEFSYELNDFNNHSFKIIAYETETGTITGGGIDTLELNTASGIFFQLTFTNSDDGCPWEGGTCDSIYGFNNAYCYTNYLELQQEQSDGTWETIYNYQYRDLPCFDENSNSETIGYNKTLSAGRYRVLVNSFETLSCVCNYRYSYPASTTEYNKGGGLRIKAIANSDSDDISTTYYDYTMQSGDEIISSGKLMSKPLYHYTMPSDFAKGPRRVPGGEYVRINNDLLTLSGNYTNNDHLFTLNGNYTKASSETIKPLGASAQGNPVGYCKVTVTKESDGDNGKTVHYYSNNAEYAPLLSTGMRYDDMLTFPGIPNLVHSSNGNLLKTEYWDAQEQLLKEEMYEYERLDSMYNIQGIKLYSIGTILGDNDDGSTPISISDYLVRFYDNVSERWNLIKDSTIIYNYDGSTTSEIKQVNRYYYDNYEHRQLTRKITTGSDGKPVATTYTYPQDLSFDDSNPGNEEEFDCDGHCDSLYWVHFYASETCTESCGSDLSCKENCVGDITNEINGQCGNCIKDSIFYKTICQAHCEQEHSSDEEEDEENDSDVIKKMIEKNMISVPIQILEKRNNNVVGGNITKYKKQGTDIIVPGVSYSIETTDPLASVEAPYIDLEGTLVIDESFKDKVHYDKYDDYGNLTQVHKTGDIYTAYLWGYNHTLPVAKVVGLSYDEVIDKIPVDIQELTGEELCNKLATLRNLDAMVTIYTYDPLIGMTSMTDENGLTTYYEYDDFGRLKCTRDDDGNIINTYKYHYAGEEE